MEIHNALTNVAHALANRERLSLLMHIAEVGQITAADIQEKMRWSKSRTTQHMQIITRSGLVRRIADGKYVSYMAAEGLDKIMSPLRKWVTGHAEKMCAIANQD